MGDFNTAAQSLVTMTKYSGVASASATIGFAAGGAIGIAALGYAVYTYENKLKKKGGET